MRASRLIFVLFLIVVSCRGKVFEPCELAKLFKYEYNEPLTKYLGSNLPFAMCVAGYHHYDTSYRRQHPNGTVAYGIFGLTESPNGPDRCTNSRYDATDDQLEDDFKCFTKTVLVHKDKAYMYHRLCASDLTRKYMCQENEYFDIVEILEPIYKDILDLSHGEEHVVVKFLKAHNIDFYEPPKRGSILIWIIKTYIWPIMKEYPSYILYPLIAICGILVPRLLR
ncbi:hypothetical protein GE061_013587 [Apolygus lucorum]|uniref:Uncharacterized protein n=1 Tax=Apolygus lucorum TaxID=248454 RepID=A0A6A4KA44_APOLU|nr:hypothetical protein GE061_013587 [Apolygus lucorum]